MRFLVIANPTGTPDSPEHLEALLDAERDWRARHAGRVDVYAWFVTGGGFGVVDVEDEAALYDAIMSHPFTPLSRYDVRPLVDADVASQRTRELFAAAA